VLPIDVLSSLPFLQRFSVSRTKKSGRTLSGPLPPFNKLPMLSILSLDGNHLTGPVPDDFIQASLNVKSVDISRNRLTGAVPSDLLLRPGLNFKSSNNNRKNETLQAKVLKEDERGILIELFKMCGGDSWVRSDFWDSKVDVCDWYGVGCNEGHVVLLNLQSNNLVGTLPRQIFDLPLLQMLWVSENPDVVLKFDITTNAMSLLDLKLDGTGTKSLKGISFARSLTALDASNNKLAGTFPDELFALENLRVLSLSNNSFVGELPESLARLRYLRVLEADSNKFSGFLPSFGDSVALTKVQVGYNELKGNIPRDFLDSVPSFASLKLFVQGNKLTGSIPQEFQRFEKLNIDFHENQIDAIPSVLCEQAGWNDGEVGKYGCDALACAPGKTNRVGRRSFESPVCVKCPAAAPFFGQVDCAADGQSSSATYSVTIALIPWIILLLVPGFGLV
jgi:Leucine rich repeat